jgi:hypothetical protein
MPTALRAAKTDKTDFMRYVNAHPGEVPQLHKRLQEYLCVHARGGGFGMWVRNKYAPDFHEAYTRWWLQRPDLFGAIYEELAGNLR